MRTVLVKKQDIENMIEHLEKNYDKMDGLINVIEPAMLDEDWDLLEEATTHLAE